MEVLLSLMLAFFHLFVAFIRSIEIQGYQCIVNKDRLLHSVGYFCVNLWNREMLTRSSLVSLGKFYKPSQNLVSAMNPDLFVE